MLSGWNVLIVFPIGAIFTASSIKAYRFCSPATITLTQWRNGLYFTICGSLHVLITYFYGRMGDDYNMTEKLNLPRFSQLSSGWFVKVHLCWIVFVKDSSQLFVVWFHAPSWVVFTLNFNNVQVDVAAQSRVFIDITNILTKIQIPTCFCI